jgi:hypothetical protein
MRDALVVVAIGLLGVLVGLTIGVRLTARRYQLALRHAPHEIDLRPNGDG